MNTSFSDSAKELFEKKFQFRSEGQKWVIPSVDVCFKKPVWSIPALMNLKDELNATKDLLEGKILHDWHQHTTYTNKAGNIISAVRRQAKPELLTQAWCKFYEILKSYPVIPDTSKLQTFHLCEAPGAFIASLNHFLQSERKHTKLRWKANTLNPYYEENGSNTTIFDDRFIFPTLNNWIFGKDNTGNVMNEGFLDDLLEITEMNGLFHMVTADGSIDCSFNPGEQEHLVASLNFTEVILALHVLAAGGSFVVKKFTLYECDSVCCMYLLNCVFKEVNVYKPGTSKSGNSEVYIVCLKYIGKENLTSFLTLAKSKIGKQYGSHAMFPLECLPPLFLEQLEHCCRQFKEYQEVTIKENLRLWDQMQDEDSSLLDYLKDECVKLFFQKYNIKYLETNKRIIKDSRPNVNTLGQNFKVMTEPCGSNDFNWQNILREITNHFMKFYPDSDDKFSVGTDCTLEWECGVPIKHERIDSKQWVTTGTTFRNVWSSKFCQQPLLNLFHRLKVHVQNVNHRNAKDFLSTEWDWLKLSSLIGMKFRPKWQYKEVCILYSDSSKMAAVVNGLKSAFPKTQEICYKVGKGELKHICSEVLVQRLTILDTVSWLDSGMEEHGIKFKKYFIQECIEILEALRKDDILVVVVKDMLSRFIVGSMYMLANLFSMVISVPFALESATDTPQVWMFGRFVSTQSNNTVQSHLKFVMEKLVQLQKTPDTTILEVCPLSRLCEEPFYSFVVKRNFVCLKNRIEWMIAERDRDDGESSTT
ncbi:cap methyltransferase 2 [Tachypleus tridentatus]|uniref:cap methyltransferase 2 n=1 Tax=Tachypleus tridentatus TaxID=6853 RepID=UPI003FD2CBE9